MSWGQEVLVDCQGCNGKIKSRADIECFIVDLCNRIDMVRVGEPQFIHIDDLGDKSGWTCFQMIRTSNVTVHFCANGDALFNVFSCKELSAVTVKLVIDEWFTPSTMHVMRVTRGEW